MSTPQPVRAPLQLETLTPAELQERYCQTNEELYALALWSHFCDLKKCRGEFYRTLRSQSYRYCPPGYYPDWMLYGSHTRAYLRFRRYCCLFVGRLESRQFKSYMRDLIEGSVISEYWFVKGEGQAIWVHIHPEYEQVDDTGQVHRTEASEEYDAWEQFDQARLEDEQHQAELEGLPLEQAENIETPAPVEENEPILETGAGQALGGGGMAPVRRNRALAQPLPRPDAVLSRKERALIMRFLILDHLATAGKAHSSNCIVRYYLSEWSMARLAVLIYGEPADTTMRNRHEKRVRDTLIHDLRSMKRVLKNQFGITSLRQV